MTENVKEYKAEEPGTDHIAALLIKNGEIRKVKLPLDEGSASEEINRLIGNWFTTAFRVPLKDGESLVGYCDDEFLLHDAETVFQNLNVALGPSLRADAPYPIGGPIVVTRVGDYGETLPVTLEQAKMLYLHDRIGVEAQNPETGETRRLPVLAVRVE